MSRTSRSRLGSESPPESRSNREPAPRASRPRPVPRAEPAATGVPDGIDYNASLIRVFGPFAGLVPMAAGGVASIALLWGSQSAVRGLAGFVLAVASCPMLPVFGFPVVSGGTTWLLGIASSTVLWIGLGVVATRRSATRAVVGWPEWRREWLRLAIGTWIGSFVGFAVAAVLLVVEF